MRINRELRYRVAFSRLGLRLTYWRMEIGCRLLGHTWQELARGHFCERCLRTSEPCGSAKSD